MDDKTLETLNEVRYLAEKHTTERIFWALRTTLQQAEKDKVEFFHIQDVKMFLDLCEEGVLEHLEMTACQNGLNVDELNEVYLSSQIKNKTTA